MEQLVILNAKGQRIENGTLVNRGSMRIYEVGANDYMNCTRESVEALQAERLERFDKLMQEHRNEHISTSCDLLRIKLVGFKNPYDEIHNLLMIAHNNAIAGERLFCETVHLNAENLKLHREKADAQRAKDLLCEFICSKGYKEEFERFCMGKVSQ